MGLISGTGCKKGGLGLLYIWALKVYGPSRFLFWVFIIVRFRIRYKKGFSLGVKGVKSANCRDQTCNFLIPLSRANLVLSENDGGP